MKDELLAGLSDEHKAIAGELQIEKLREYVKLNKATTNSMDSARTGGYKNVDFSKITDAKKLTLKELEEIRKSNPAKYNELLKLR